MNSFKVLIVIPARGGSTRLAGKPLAQIGNKTVLQRVWGMATRSKLANRIIVATDTEEIATHAKSFGAQVLLTSSECETGSDRVAEVTRILAASGENYDAVMNVQGDLPFIQPELIDSLIEDFAKNTEFQMGTVATPIDTSEEYLRESTVKVALGENNKVLYFSRSPIPFWRNGSPPVGLPYSYKHMGLYIFRPDTLEKFSSLKPAVVEQAEKLEQLRALANGVNIRVLIATPELVWPSIEIDTPDDLHKAKVVVEEFDRKFGIE